MSKEARFGGQFKIDKQNRTDVLGDQKDLPSYVKTAREVRQILKSNVEKEGWPKQPKLEKLEDLFEAAKAHVDEVWQSDVQSLLDAKRAEWLAMVPDQEDTSEIRKELQDATGLEEKMRIRQFGVLEDVRNFAPDVWRELLLLSAERQMAAIELARHWTNELADDDKDALSKKFGLGNFAEVDLFLDVASLTGKYIDHAYLKQVELADMPGGKTPTVLTGKKGARRIYELPTDKENKFDFKTFSEVLPFEWPQLVKNLKVLEQKVQDLLGDGTLGKEYELLPAYLAKMATAYGSISKNIKTLPALWLDLLASSSKLAESGCPIMLVPQDNPGVAGKAKKIDAEIRLGLRTKEIKAMESKLAMYRSLANQMSAKYEPYLEKGKKYEIPTAQLNYQPYAYGPNLYWMTQGESGEQSVVSHVNAMTEVAEGNIIPMMKKVFGETIDKDSFNSAYILSTVRHEFGHAIIPIGDKKVMERVGVSNNDTAVISELKADTFDSKLLLASRDAGHEGAEFDEQKVFLAILGNVCNYLANKSPSSDTTGQAYYYDGVALVSALVDAGVIVEKGDGFNVMDAKKGLETLAGLNDEVSELHLSKQPADLKKYVDAIKNKAEKPIIKKLIQRLKAK
jgi:hypothetical protein